MERWRKLQEQMSPKSGLDRAKESMASVVSRVFGQQQAAPPVKQRTRREKFHTLDVEISHHVKARIVSPKRRELFSAVLGEAVPPHTEFSVRRYDDQLIVKFIGYATLTITHLKNEKSHRYDVEWRMAKDAEGYFQDAVSFCYNHWFGGCMSEKQSWPISDRHKISPFVSWDTHYDPAGGYGSVLERYWLSSSGVALYVDSEVPLFVGTDDHENPGLSLISKFDKPYRNLFDYNLFLKYSIFEAANIKAVHDLVREEYFLKSEGLPCKELFEKPIWSTSHFGSDVSDEKVLQLVEECLERGFKPAILEFSDDWTPAYGDMVFDPKRFLDSKAMVQTIKNNGFKVILWVHPFSSPRSDAFYDGQNLWVKSAMVEGVTAWEHGPAKILDVTNPDSRTWLKKKLMDLKEDYSLDGFLFDHGQVNYLPALSNTYDPLTNPNSFSRSYIGIATDIAYQDRFSLVRTGVGTQNVPLMLCMEERRSCWGWDNGLKTVIPSVLTLGMMGYLYVLPGTVGGGDGHKSEVDSELYIRWLETVILMPALKFSVPPWHFGEETLDCAQNLMKIRKSYLEYIERVAAASEETGDPMVRPLWWRAPNDSIAVTVDSQFMVGEELLVAPVQEKGMTNRSIYLPSGMWKDELRGTTIEGKKWLYSYRARLGELPHFTLMKKKAIEEEK